MSTVLWNNCPSRTANSRATLLSSVYCSDVFYLPDYTHRCTAAAMHCASQWSHYCAAAER